MRLNKLLSALFSWIGADRRRILGAIAIPLFVVIAIIGPRGHSSSPSSTNVGDTSSAGTATTSSGIPGVPTAPVTIGPSDKPRPPVSVPAEASSIATKYVTTVNSHDARPGHDKAYLDSYRRARPFVTDEVYQQLTESDPSARPLGDAAWTQWSSEQASVTVHIDHVAVPDGAPIPTRDTVYVQVDFTQKIAPTRGSDKASNVQGTARLVVSRQSNGQWLISQLLSV